MTVKLKRIQHGVKKKCCFLDVARKKQADSDTVIILYTNYNLLPCMV